MSSSLATHVRSNDELSTEARLRQSAVKLFASKGYDATSIREIIEDAGVTRPVLYYYFKNKEDLFTKLIESEFRAALRELDEAAAAGTGFRDTLIRVMQCAFERAEASPELVQMMLQFFFSPPDVGVGMDRQALADERFRRIAAVINQGLESKEIAGGDPFGLTVVFCGIMDMHVMARSGRPEGRLSRELAESLVDFFLDGARPGNTSKKPIRSAFNFEAPQRAQ